MNEMPASDEGLLARMAQRDESALDELYRRYGRLVFSIARHMVGDQATAEEITLDVFTQTWHKAATYQANRAKVSTWLTSMARHRAIDELRRRNVRPEKHSVSWAEIQREPAAAEGNPVTAVQHTLEQQRVRAAVAQLPPEQQDVLALAYFRGYSHSEIAEILTLPLGTVKTRIRIAMQKLRQLLTEP